MTARDIEKAEALIKYCWNDRTGRSFRQAVAEEIANLIAELRKAKKAK